MHDGEPHGWKPSSKVLVYLCVALLGGSWLLCCKGSESISVLTGAVSKAQSYAEPLLDILDPERRYFSHRLYRDACLRVPSRARPGMAFLMKDLTSLGRPLEGLLIVDNTPTVSHKDHSQAADGKSLGLRYQQPPK